MRNCPNCHEQVPFKLIFASFWKGYQDIECPACGTKLKHKFKNRIFGGLTGGLSPSLSFLFVDSLTDDYTSVLIYSLVLTVTLGVLFSSIFIQFCSFERAAR